MFTDMVGYTALVQQDEQRARHQRDRQREVLALYIPAHGGRILQSYGDGALSVFDSAIEAVSSAVAIQQELSKEPRVLLRVGIHSGDIVYDDDGVFGDGVNVASRIQSLATPGSILISAKVYDEIKNQPQFNAVALGEFNLKNVQRPIEVFGIAAEGIALPATESLPSQRMQSRRRVAVLPFINLSADAENEFLADGITEELITVLARVNGLQVTARTSSFAFKGRNEDVRQIASQLGVDVVLEGSVRKAGDRVRITAQLIDAPSGYHLFAENYDRRLSDIFELQDEIARAIVEAVRDRLFPERAAVGQWSARFDRLEAFLATRHTNLKAHHYYVHGLQEYSRWTPESLRRGIDLLKSCLKEDPDCAPAHAALSRAYGYRASVGQVDMQSGWQDAEAAARRAVELDPELGEAHVALGLSRLFRHWDVQSAYEHIQKGVGLSPGSALARQAFGIHLIVLGEAERAIEEMDMAARLDPLSLLMHLSLAWAYMEAERYTDAIEVCDRILAIDPMFRAAYDEKGMALMQLGRLQEAAASFQRVVEITGDSCKGLGIRGANFARMGRTDEARRALATLRECAQNHPEQSLEIDFARLHHSLGEFDDAFQYVEAAAEKRLAEILYSVNSPSWREFRKHARYWGIIDKRGLSSIAREPGVVGGNG
jgi:TolB-like protein/Flp pilus assembly protein TadD